MKKLMLLVIFFLSIGFILVGNKYLLQYEQLQEADRVWQRVSNKLVSLREENRHLYRILLETTEQRDKHYNQWQEALDSIVYFRDGWLKQTDLTNEQFVELEELKVEIVEWEACAIRRKKEDSWFEDWVARQEAKPNEVLPEKLSLVDLIPQVKPSVVHIDVPQWQGSGFVVTPNLIATARHCVEGQENFLITLDDGSKIQASRAISSKKYDIAFIWVEEGLPNPVTLGSVTECQLGQELFAIGSGYGKINFNSVTKGIVSALDRDYDELNNGPYGEYDYGWSVAFQTDTPGFPGNSGCPLFSLDGKVVGVLVGGFNSSLIIVMPVDLFPSLEKVELMFLMDEFYKEEAPEFSVYEYMRKRWQ